MDPTATLTAFAGHSRIARGDVRSVVLKAREHVMSQPNDATLVFEDATGRQIDFDLSGSPEEVLARLAAHPALTPEQQGATRSGPGRPKLGVVCREVSLLPRHWEWLQQQPQGASAAIRRLVDEARKKDPEGQRARAARDAAAQFMWAMAGNFEGFEDASRALFSGDRKSFERIIGRWPKDVREHILHLLEVS